eukprot:TRINITY_DN4003_c0_g1_i1.p1 TRINITY_DN4003_c0_g1~~TRINITY_DN4003_c0_g1_i1.p1  ORF type:complete len:1442 (+),score=267.23 TRINITY_DN4003_c0_g1_i1:59-4384(+)
MEGRERSCGSAQAPLWASGRPSPWWARAACGQEVERCKRVFERGDELLRWVASKCAEARSPLPPPSIPTWTAVRPRRRKQQAPAAGARLTPLPTPTNSSVSASRVPARRPALTNRCGRQRLAVGTWPWPRAGRAALEGGAPAPSSAAAPAPTASQRSSPQRAVRGGAALAAALVTQEPPPADAAGADTRCPPNGAGGAALPRIDLFAGRRQRGVERRSALLFDERWARSDVVAEWQDGVACITRGEEPGEATARAAARLARALRRPSARSIAASIPLPEGLGPVSDPLRREPELVLERELGLRLELELRELAERGCVTVAALGGALAVQHREGLCQFHAAPADAEAQAQDAAAGGGAVPAEPSGAAAECVDDPSPEVGQEGNETYGDDFEQTCNDSAGVLSALDYTYVRSPLGEADRSAAQFEEAECTADPGSAQPAALALAAAAVACATGEPASTPDEESSPRVPPPVDEPTAGLPADTLCAAEPCEPRAAREAAAGGTPLCGSPKAAGEAAEEPAAAGEEEAAPSASTASYDDGASQPAADACDAAEEEDRAPSTSADGEEAGAEVQQPPGREAPAPLEEDDDAYDEDDFEAPDQTFNEGDAAAHGAELAAEWGAWAGHFVELERMVAVEWFTASMAAAWEFAASAASAAEPSPSAAEAAGRAGQGGRHSVRMSQGRVSRAWQEPDDQPQSEADVVEQAAREQLPPAAPENVHVAPAAAPTVDPDAQPGDAEPAAAPSQPSPTGQPPSLPGRSECEAGEQPEVSPLHDDRDADPAMQPAASVQPGAEQADRTITEGGVRCGDEQAGGVVQPAAYQSDGVADPSAGSSPGASAAGPTAEAAAAEDGAEPPLVQPSAQDAALADQADPVRGGSGGEATEPDYGTAEGPSKASGAGAEGGAAEAQQGAEQEAASAETPPGEASDAAGACMSPAAAAITARQQQRDQMRLQWEGGERFTEVVQEGAYKWFSHVHPERTMYYEEAASVPECIVVRVYIPEARDPGDADAAVAEEAGGSGCALSVTAGAAATEIQRVSLPYPVGGYVRVDFDPDVQVLTARCLVELPEMAPEQSDSAPDPHAWSPEQSAQRRQQKEPRVLSIHPQGTYDWSQHRNPVRPKWRKSEGSVPRTLVAEVLLPSITGMGEVRLTWDSPELARIVCKGNDVELAELQWGFPVDKRSLKPLFSKRDRVLTLTAAVALPETRERADSASPPRKASMMHDLQSSGTRFTSVTTSGEYDWSRHARPEAMELYARRDDVPDTVVVTIFHPESGPAQATVSSDGSCLVLPVPEGECSVRLPFPVDRGHVVQKHKEKAQILKCTLHVLLPDPTEDEPAPAPTAAAPAAAAAAPMHPAAAASDPTAAAASDPTAAKPSAAAGGPAAAPAPAAADASSPADPFADVPDEDLWWETIDTVRNRPYWYNAQAKTTWTRPKHVVSFVPPAQG